LALNTIAAYLNPTVFLKDPGCQNAHEEVITWVTRSAAQPSGELDVEVTRTADERNYAKAEFDRGVMYNDNKPTTGDPPPPSVNVSENYGGQTDPASSATVYLPDVEVAETLTGS